VVAHRFGHQQRKRRRRQHVITEVDQPILPTPHHEVEHIGGRRVRMRRAQRQ